VHAGVTSTGVAANQNVSTVITGATRVDQVRENMSAPEVFAEGDADVLSRVDAIVGPSVDRA
jgi:aryl-alcohol dehydrogenase-like predicted oxidoreductase